MPQRVLLTNISEKWENIYERMPQLDIFALFPQFFWFSFTFIIVYFDIYLLVIILMLTKDTRDLTTFEFYDKVATYPWNGRLRYF